MAFDRTRLRNSYWWMALVGLILQIAGFFLHSRDALTGNIASLVGLALLCSLLKLGYDSFEVKTKPKYELFPQNRESRIR